jgi:hypothetical protein
MFLIRARINRRARRCCIPPETATHAPAFVALLSKLFSRFFLAKLFPLIWTPTTGRLAGIANPARCSGAGREMALDGVYGEWEEHLFVIRINTPDKHRMNMDSWYEVLARRLIG